MVAVNQPLPIIRPLSGMQNQAEDRQFENKRKHPEFHQTTFKT
jgi:hypothetical protein